MLFSYATAFGGDTRALYTKLDVGRICQNRSDSWGKGWALVASLYTSLNVDLFAYGPGSLKFSGNYDNTDIRKKISELMRGESIFPEPLVD